LLVSEANFRQIFPAEAAPRGFLVATADGRAGPVATVLRRRLAPYGAEVRETREILAGLAGVQNAYLAVFLVLGGFGLLLGTVGMAVLLLRSAADRRSEFALLAAIGFTRRALAWNLALEHAALSFLGLMLGATAALVASAPVLAGPDSRCDWPTLGVVLVAALAVSLAGASVAVGHGVAANSAAYLRTE
jgi:ABC-type antimicrobial peptide transport system permease subunit